MSRVAVLSHRGLLALLLPCLLFWPARPVLSAPPEKKRVTVLDLITFTWSLAPEDPFSKENAPDASPSTFRRGQTFILTISGKPKEGYHTYPLTVRTETQTAGNSKITYGSADSFTPLWPVTESAPVFVDEGGPPPDPPDINLEHEKPFTWKQEFLVKPDAKPGAAKLSLVIYLQVCANSCVSGEYPLEIPITIAPDPAMTLTPATLEKMKAIEPQPVVLKVTPDTKIITRERTKTGIELPTPLNPPNKPDQIFKAKGTLEFVLTGMWFGLISLVTPCVFPMIPITVSFFLKQSEQKHNSPLLLASVYSGTIVTVLTLGGLAFSTVLAFVSQHWATNLLLGGLFLFFALSLFGMYEIMLPTGLANLTSARQGTGGLAGSFFMALTFTIISFACVAPFYGSFLIYTASASTANDWFKLFFGALAYSATFASPFFVLALFPTLLRTLPSSGSWMNTIKVVMGFIEVAAALKFLRAAELAFFKSSNFLTFDLVLGLYVALCVLCGLYLLNLYRLPHDYEPLATLGVPRTMFALVFIGLGLYLTPALFKQPDGESQRPGGKVYSWIEAFLLPEEREPASNGGTKSASNELVWSGELKKSLTKAEAEKKLVFVDFTAILCTNCRYNERTVFKKPEIIDLLGRYQLVKLYTDGIPKWMNAADPAQENKRLQLKYAGDELPVYMILKPDPTNPDGFEIIGKYDEGLINSPDKFAEFLKRDLSTE